MISLTRSFCQDDDICQPEELSESAQDLTVGQQEERMEEGEQAQDLSEARSEEESEGGQHRAPPAGTSTLLPTSVGMDAWSSGPVKEEERDTVAQ